MCARLGSWLAAFIVLYLLCDFVRAPYKSLLPSQGREHVNFVFNCKLSRARKGGVRSISPQVTPTHGATGGGVKETGPAWNEDLRVENGGIRGVNRVRDMLIVLAVTFFSDLVLGVSRQPWVFACFAARRTAVGCTVMEINARQSASARVAHHRSVVYHGFWTPGVCARFHALLRLWSGHKPQINLLCLLPLGQAELPTTIAKVDTVDSG